VSDARITPLRGHPVDPQAPEIGAHDLIDRGLVEVEVAARGHQHAPGQLVEPAAADLDAETRGKSTSAIARPIPRPAPVTTATSPTSFM
jgi:hypothetical protein